MILFYTSLILNVEESKFLGLIFDRKLSFIANIKYLKEKCLKALNILKSISHTSFNRCVFRTRPNYTTQTI